MNSNSIYITILLIIILILLIIYYCYYYNSRSNIENYTNLDCTNYRDGNYCKQIGEENTFWCFIKKMFCFIIYLKNKITTKDEVIKTKDTQIGNLENKVITLDDKLVDIKKRIETITTALNNSDSTNTVSASALIESENQRQEEKDKCNDEKKNCNIKKNNLLFEKNSLQVKANDLKTLNDAGELLITNLQSNVDDYKRNETDIVRECNIDIIDGHDEAQKKESIVFQLKNKCNKSDSQIDTGASTNGDSNVRPSHGLFTQVVNDEEEEATQAPVDEEEEATQAPVEEEEEQEEEEATQAPVGSNQHESNSIIIPNNPDTFTNNLLPTKQEVDDYKQKCLNTCIHSMCLNLDLGIKAKCESDSENLDYCRKSCNKVNEFSLQEEFTLQECSEFDCKSDNIKYKIQNNYNTKISSLLNDVANTDMNFQKSNIDNSSTPLNCDVDYEYTLFNSKGIEVLSGNNKRKFEFEKNVDCTYTLLNMGISQTTEDNMESIIGSTSFAL